MRFKCDTVHAFDINRVIYEESSGLYLSVCEPVWKMLYDLMFVASLELHEGPGFCHTAIIGPCGVILDLGISEDFESFTPKRQSKALVISSLKPVWPRAQQSCPRISSSMLKPVRCAFFFPLPLSVLSWSSGRKRTRR